MTQVGLGTGDSCSPAPLGGLAEEFLRGVEGVVEVLYGLFRIAQGVQQVSYDLCLGLDFGSRIGDFHFALLQRGGGVLSSVLDVGQFLQEGCDV